MGPQPGFEYGGVANESPDDRFLDLVGARFDAIPGSGGIAVRPNALSRFMLFSNYQVIEDDADTLRQLRDPAFNPTTTVLLAQRPEPAFTASPGDARKIESGPQRPSNIELEFDAPYPAILFFDDSYDAGWSATVNGEDRKVGIADFQFMGVSVPAGHNRVTFRFRPLPFVHGLLMTGAFFLAYAGIGGFMYFRSRRDPITSPIASPPPAAP
jgi:hypothetical protein